MFCAIQSAGHYLPITYEIQKQQLQSRHRYLCHSTFARGISGEHSVDSNGDPIKKIQQSGATLGHY